MYMLDFCASIQDILIKRQLKEKETNSKKHSVFIYRIWKITVFILGGRVQSAGTPQRRTSLAIEFTYH